MNEQDWERRYREDSTGWDMGQVSPPLKAYFDQLEDKKQKILIPGCGNAYEAGYLHSQGFENVFVIDVASSPLSNLKKRMPGFPDDHMLQADFFEHEGRYDLIVEQTFFCAIDPSLRQAYAEKAKGLLRPGGRLVGLLFDDPLNKDHPPYGGNKKEYLNYFDSLFKVRTFERAYNSIPPRQGKELFIILEK